MIQIGRRALSGVVAAAVCAVLGAGLAVAVATPAAAEPLDPRRVGSGTSSGTGDPVRTGDATVTGSGYGHGVGMSQYGAFAMARAGWTPTQILTHYYTGIDVAGVPDVADVKVNVLHRGRSLVLEPVAVAGVSGHLLRLATREGATTSLGVGDRARLTPSGSGLTVAVTRAAGSPGTGPTALTASGLGADWTGTRSLAGTATRLVTRADVSGSLTPKVRSYRWGRLWVSNLSGLLEAVVTVDLHSEYLRGVAEMPSSWPAAALQAQAVVARSYALTAVAAGTRSGCGGCQLWDDQRSQVYTGWAKESERVGSTDYGARWVAAVSASQPDAGTGTAALYRGRPINAVYSSSSGGRTRSSADVWGGTVPYLSGVDDPWSLDAVNPLATWTRTVKVSGLTAMFGVADLTWVGVTARDDAGAATQVSALSGAGRRVSVTGQTFRSRLGMPSSWVGDVRLPVS